MSWTAPRVWVYGELVTATIMNTDIRDNLFVLKTYADDEGGLLAQRWTFGYSAGQSNTSTGVWQVLSSFNVNIPANYLNVPGDAVMVDGVFLVAQNANLKNAGFYYGTGGPFQFWQGAENLAAHRVHFRFTVRRRTTTTGVFAGVAWQWASPTPVALSAQKMIHTTLSGGNVDFTASRDIQFAVNCPAAADLTLAEVYVCGFRSKVGATV